MRTTVLMPLHRSGPWRQSISQQIADLSGTANILISDATALDDTLAWLRAEHRHDPSIEWLDARPLASGWVAHANDLLERATTEFVMWLPHDDHIDPTWVTQAEGELDRRPEAIAACGSIRPLQLDSFGRGGAIDVPPFATESELHPRLMQAIESLLTQRTGDLGLLFRSVTRRALAPRLPPGIAGDDWADVLWALRLLSIGPIVEIAATYGKRWHDRSTHASWVDHTADTRALRSAIVQALSDLSAVDSATVLTTAWAHEVDRVNAALSFERRSNAQAIIDLNDRYERSRSWRLTAPLRRLVAHLGPKPRR